jgi:hypothetical protein
MGIEASTRKIMTIQPMHMYWKWQLMSKRLEHLFQLLRDDWYAAKNWIFAVPGN